MASEEEFWGRRPLEPGRIAIDVGVQPKVGDAVQKAKGEFSFPGFIVATFVTRSGKPRVVVEHAGCVRRPYRGKYALSV